ncbi:MAG TPA: sigma-70 family RNA polymerase sigma factor [Acidimicrobiales bacterium]|jgi:RNA polymerase sigma-B factor|nr:sigma-70 family RNA polymerase sigma factor [Acidimicrobiales bacterium]
MQTRPRPEDPTASSPDRERLVTDHLDLAAALARRYAGGRDVAEVTQVAMLGLVLAAARFEPDRGIPFGGYASATIVGEIKHHFRDTRWALHLPRSVKERYLQLRDTEERLAKSLRRAPRWSEVTASAAVSDAEATEAAIAGNVLAPTSMHEHTDADNPAPPPQLGVPDPGMDAVERRHLVSHLLSRVPEAERELLRLRYTEELSQDQIAARLGVSQMQVSRRLSRSLDRLRVLARAS